MPKLKRMSTKEVVSALEEFGFVVVGQRGSHVKIARKDDSGNKQVLTIPNHKEIKKGTLKAIFRQASRYIPEKKLRDHFYTD